MNQEVSVYLNNLKKWQVEFTVLRKIILASGLFEDYKWKHPCYTKDGKNILLIHGFKDYCAILFIKGALLKDPKNILIQQTENTQAARQIRFTNVSEIATIEPIIKQYIIEAIGIELAGLKVKKKKAIVEIPFELEEKFKENPEFKKAFNALTLGRQNGYLLHFVKPIQSKTKTARIEKNIARILNGYGLTDCTCGLTKRKPNCDGSHKYI